MIYDRKRALSEQGYDCQSCGQRVSAKKFHSYEACLLHKLDKAPSLLSRYERRHIFRLGVDAMRERVQREESP